MATARRAPSRLPTRDEVLAERCRRSLATFIREAWPAVEPNEYVHGWHIDSICEHLQAVTEGHIDRLIINQPPRTMKSLTVSVFWPLWEWLRRPETRWLFLSYAQTLAIRDSLRCRRLLTLPGGQDDGTLIQRVGFRGLVELLGGDWTLAPDQAAKGRFENTEGGYRIAASVGGTATGEGGDRVVCDDPHSAAQADSDTERKNALDWWDATIPTRLNDPDRGAIVVVMQRLHETDLTGHLLAQDPGRWTHLCLPARTEPKHPFPTPARVELPPREIKDEKGEPVVKPGREIQGDIRTEDDELLDPIRLGEARLADLRKSMGSIKYAGQMQQRPAPEEGGMLKKAWWKRYSTPPSSFDAWCTSWDLTFGEEDAGTSWVCGQVWAKKDADIFLLYQLRGRWAFGEQVAKVKWLSQKFPRARPIIVEKAAAGVPVVESLKRKVSGIKAESPEGSKAARAGACAPYLEAGNVWVPEHEPWAEQLIDEAAMFPNGADDDMVDAFAQAALHLFLGQHAVEVQSYRPQGSEPVIRRGDLTLRGKHHIDK